MSDQEATWRTEADKRRDLRQRKIANAKSAVRMFFFTAFWRVLWLARLARPYSKLMCRLGWYSKFPDGRCHWCGVVK